MLAGDGATRVRADPECSRCGVALEGTIRVRVDEWHALACRQCAAGETWPARCIVYPPPRRRGGRDVTRDPWKYRCREGGSVALTPRVSAGGYRCDKCGAVMAAHKRLDAKRVA